MKLHSDSDDMGDSASLQVLCNDMDFIEPFDVREPERYICLCIVVKYLQNHLQGAESWKSAKV